MKNPKMIVLPAIVLVAFVGGWLWAGKAPAGTGGSAVTVNGNGLQVVMYQNPACGCCGSWAEHMRQAGFEVEVHKTPELNDIKRREGITAEFAACHTAYVDGYIVEGHVPAADVERMLRERPEIKGIATPGMPMGSPGMEGDRVDDYDVVAFDDQGNTSVFASHRASSR